VASYSSLIYFNLINKFVLSGHHDSKYAIDD
jgi:hypothetical protein